jgi:molecular chaperone Hsp33
MSATTLLLGDNLKQPVGLTIQLRGNGPVSLLVIDCNEQLQIRGMASVRGAPQASPVPELLGDGQLLLSLDMPSMREPYQSIVPLDGESIAEVFEHYLGSRNSCPRVSFWPLRPSAAAGLFLQKLPDRRSVRCGWLGTRRGAGGDRQGRGTLVAACRRTAAPPLSEETVRLFPAKAVVHNCPEDWEKVRTRCCVRSAPPKSMPALREHGEVLIRDDLCNLEYRFDAPAIDELFAMRCRRRHRRGIDAKELTAPCRDSSSPADQGCA